jgi:tetratricopeptide (TPR) repeat protein
VYEAMLKLTPDSFRAWHNRGHSLFSLGRFDDALASFERAVEHFPQYAMAHFRIAELHRIAGRPAQARQAAERAVAAAPRGAKYHLSLAHIAAMQGDWSAALAAARSARELGIGGLDDEIERFKDEIAATRKWDF